MESGFKPPVNGAIDCWEVKSNSARVTGDL